MDTRKKQVVWGEPFQERPNPHTGAPEVLNPYTGRYLQKGGTQHRATLTRWDEEQQGMERQDKPKKQQQQDSYEEQELPNGLMILATFQDKARALYYLKGSGLQGKVVKGEEGTYSVIVQE